MAKKEPDDGRELSHLWRVIQTRWLDTSPYPPSQAKLAQRLEVSAQLVSDWKWGASSPNSEDLDRLAEEIKWASGLDLYDELLVAVNLDRGYRPQRSAG